MDVGREGEGGREEGREEGGREGGRRDGGREREFSFKYTK